MAGRLIQDVSYTVQPPQHTIIQIRSRESCYPENAALMQLLADRSIMRDPPSLYTTSTDSMAGNRRHLYTTVELLCALVLIQQLIQ